MKPAAGTATKCRLTTARVKAGLVNTFSESGEEVGESDYTGSLDRTARGRHPERT